MYRYNIHMVLAYGVHGHLFVLLWVGYQETLVQQHCMRAAIGKGPKNWMNLGPTWREPWFRNMIRDRADLWGRVQNFNLNCKGSLQLISWSKSGRRSFITKPDWAVPQRQSEHQWCPWGRNSPSSTEHLANDSPPDVDDQITGTSDLMVQWTIHVCPSVCLQPLWEVLMHACFCTSLHLDESTESSWKGEQSAWDKVLLKVGIGMSGS